MDRAEFAGASGGALSATLAGCGVVDTEDALRVAVRLCDEVHAFDRGAWALRGIWGGMVRTWLEELLPPDAAERCQGRVHILVYQPFHGRRLLSEFESRGDLIAACLASCHIPWYMDGGCTARFRGGHYIDSDLLPWRQSSKELILPGGAPSVRLSYGRDQRLRDKYSKPSDILRLTSPEAVHEMLRWGESHVDELDVAGKLGPLDGIRVQSDGSGGGAIPV